MAYRLVLAAAFVWLAASGAQRPPLREFPADFARALAMCPAGQETYDLRAAFAAAAEAIAGVRLQRGTLNEDVARMSAIAGPLRTIRTRDLDLPILRSS